MKRHSGMTLMEVMVAVALSSMICAIGFTGIVAFSRSITKSKQFTSETELIVSAIRASIASADSVTATPQFTSYINQSYIPVLPTTVPVPKNWVSLTQVQVPAGTPECSILTFSNQLTVSGVGAAQTTAATTGDVRKALNMDNGTNTLSIRAFACY